MTEKLEPRFDANNYSSNYLNELARMISGSLSKTLLQDLFPIFGLMDEHYLGAGRIFTLGNGGSGATASHFVGDLMKGANLSGGTFDARCLVDNLPTFLAIANDISYDDVFFHQLPKDLNSEDTIFALSGSGKSRNVIRAVERAQSAGAVVVGLTGFDGGLLRGISTFGFHVQSNHMGIVEDTHHALLHMLAWRYIRRDETS